MAPLTECHASIADVTNEEHQNMADLVQPNDFNAEVVVRFLRATMESMPASTSRPMASASRSPIRHARRMLSSPASACAHR